MPESRRIKTRLWLSLTFIMVILILSTLFHRPVHIIDALTSDIARDFGIHVSPWRLLFEPVLGPLLFFLRAEYALANFANVLFWCLILLLASMVVAFFRARFRQKGSFSWKDLLGAFARAPIIVSIWLAVLLSMIFIPLPANRIVNRAPDTILLNVHAHSEYSHDGLISQKNLLKWHEKNGFDAFFITDHNHHARTLEAVQAQEQGMLPSKPLLLAGQEFSGSNHILLLGLTRDFTNRDLPDSTVIDSAQAQDGVAIVAHWFDDQKNSIQTYIDRGADGFEIVNQNGGIYYDRQVFHGIVAACVCNGLLMLGGCDYHGYGSTCRTWNALKIPGWHRMPRKRQRQAILDILRRHDQSKIRVLIYEDRGLLARGRSFASPLYTILDYFRSLNFWQVLSWIIWLALLVLASMAPRKKPGSKWYGLMLWGIAGEVSALLALWIGVMLLLRRDGVAGYNEIYSEFGHLFLWIGLGFFVYCSGLLVLAGRKNRHKANSAAIGPL